MGNELQTDGEEETSGEGQAETHPSEAIGFSRPLGRGRPFGNQPSWSSGITPPNTGHFYKLSIRERLDAASERVGQGEGGRETPWMDAGPRRERQRKEAREGKQSLSAAIVIKSAFVTAQQRG